MSLAFSAPRGLPPLPEIGASRPRIRSKAGIAGREGRGGGHPAASQGSDRGVFDIVPMLHTTIHDVRDAVEACSPCDSDEARRSCFVVFGLDSDKVDKHLWAVEMLLRCKNRKGVDDGKNDWLKGPSGP